MLENRVVDCNLIPVLKAIFTYIENIKYGKEKVNIDLFNDYYDLGVSDFLKHYINLPKHIENSFRDFNIKMEEYHDNFYFLLNSQAYTEMQSNQSWSEIVIAANTLHSYLLEYYLGMGLIPVDLGKSKDEYFRIYFELNRTKI